MYGLVWRVYIYVYIYIYINIYIHTYILKLRKVGREEGRKAMCGSASRKEGNVWERFKEGRDCLGGLQVFGRASTVWEGFNCLGGLQLFGSASRKEGWF